MHVLDRVVLVHVEVAAGEKLEVESGVEAEQRQEVVEEADARLDTHAAVPSSESVSRSAVSVVVRRRVASRPGAGPGSAPSARSTTSFSDGRRTVIRIAPGKALTTIPCASSRSASGSSVTTRRKFVAVGGQS